MTSKSARKNILTPILKKIAEDNGIKHYAIEKEEIPCTGKNYTAAIYIIRIRVKEKCALDLFAKVAKANENERKAMQISEMYRRERFVYLELVKIYEGLQDKYRVAKGDRYNFVKFYAAHAEPMEETVVLENLISKGYHTPDRFEPMDWLFASKAVAQLAKFHALSFVFEREDPKLFEKLIKTRGEFIYTKCRPPPELFRKYTRDRVNAAKEGLSKENLERFTAFLKRNDPNRGHQDQHKLQRRPCLVHGDYKHTNLMTKCQNTKIVDLVPVDFQLVHYGSPINDLMYFIFTGSDEKFRERYYEELIEHYYSNFSKALERFSLQAKEIYPREDFDSDLKERTIYGFYIGLFILPFMLAEKKPDFSHNVDDLVIDSGTEYRERFNGIVSDFVKWGYL